MFKNYNSNLEERTFKFAKEVAIACKCLSKDVINYEYVKQLIRSSASIGANYIEANESLSKKDFIFRIKICLKEAKESIYWLRLIFDINNEESSKEISKLVNESTELKKIFCSIILNSKG